MSFSSVSPLNHSRTSEWEFIRVNWLTFTLKGDFQRSESCTIQPHNFNLASHKRSCASCATLYSITKKKELVRSQTLLNIVESGKWDFQLQKSGLRWDQNYLRITGLYDRLKKQLVKNKRLHQSLGLLLFWVMNMVLVPFNLWKLRKRRRATTATGHGPSPITTKE